MTIINRKQFRHRPQLSKTGQTLIPCTNCPPNGWQLKLPTEGEVPDLIAGVPDPLQWPRQETKQVGWEYCEEIRVAHIAALRTLFFNKKVPPPVQAEGEGILFVSGGRFWPMTVCAIRMVRDVSNLPIRIYTVSPVFQEDVADLADISFIDLRGIPARAIGGWESKVTAILDCPWEVVLYLDADAYPVTDPSNFLRLATQETPFVYWSDMPDHDNAVKWGGFGIDSEKGQKVHCVQGGQLAINRKWFWKELILAHWLNQHSDYSYSFGFGDQDQWRVSMAMCGTNFKCLGRSPWKGVGFHYDYEGSIIVHRPQGKVWLESAKVTSHLPGDVRYFQHYQDFINKPKTPAEVFSRIYALNAWGKGSGTGSQEAEARPYLEIINGLFYVKNWHLGCSSVVDLGCGDGYITSRLDCPYITAVDCCTKESHGNINTRNLTYHKMDLDADREKLPTGNVALLKDVLHHWPRELILDWLNWAKKCRKWDLLILTYDYPNADNKDIKLGGYRALDSTLFPLSAIPGLRRFVRYLHKEVSILKL